MRFSTKLIPALAAITCIAAGISAASYGQHVVPPGGYGRDDGVPNEREQILEDIRVRIARIRYGGGGDWYSDPSSLPNLLGEFQKRTGIPAAGTEKIIEIGDPNLFSCPLLYMTGHGNIKLSREELAALREHLLGGGFLYADDNYGMDESFREMVGELFPERELVLLPLDHGIYHSFYDLGGPPKIHEHDGKQPQGYGVFNGDRLMIFYTYESDIGDGLEDPDVHGDPPEKREQAFQMAVNVIYYALTQ
jgi:hypothetical protein